MTYEKKHYIGVAIECEDAPVDGVFAADVIARTRAAARAEGVRSRDEAFAELHDQLTAAKAEIERLRSSNLSARQNADHAQAEIERLRLGRDVARQGLPKCAISYGELATKLENLRAAAERYRDAEDEDRAEEFDALCAAIEASR